MKETKLQTLIFHEGFTDFNSMLTHYEDAGCFPGICTNPGCCYTTEVEPDQARGWCEACNTQSVCSGLLIAGMI